jgi:Bifunctional DNA primase/polymerase, N-terminal
MDSYSEWAPRYRGMGFWPRPINLGSKACRIPKWQTPDDQLPPKTLEHWLRRYGHFGIGLLMGSPLPDGTALGALDVDRDEYVGLAKALLQSPVCGRIGKKGAVFFVRVAGNFGNPEFRVGGTLAKEWGKVAECLFRKKLCVIPPTIHPETNSSYRWIGTPLHEVDFACLPLIGDR